MEILSRCTIRLPIFMKNLLIVTKNYDKRFIMTSLPRLEKALENLEKNPFFEKYANKIAKFQQTSPDEFLQRIESQEKKLQKKKVYQERSHCIQNQCLRTIPHLFTSRPSSWTHIKRNNFYITTPIFYVNAGPHIGHVYTAVLADTIARFNAMLGHSVFLCTGTDEHGTKVQKAANVAGLPILKYCTKVSNQFRKMCDIFQVDYSKFIRTTEKRHQEAVYHFWNCLEQKGHIYRGKYAGWYNVSDEAFVSDKEIAKKCTNSNEAYLISGDVVEWTEEDTYKFRLASFQDDIKYWLKNDKVIYPAMYRNMLFAWLDNLQDLSISRPIERVPWAIPTPSDESQAIYVWLDALVNYLTSVGYPNDSFKQFWPPTVQVIGKDILKFHGIYWPAFLIAAGLEPPKQLVCHGHWAVKDKKMSKSKGNVISPFIAMQDFTQDGLRYFLLRQAVLHGDANYNEVKARKILNSELADTLGNLINRCFGKAINPNRVIYSSDYDEILRSEVARKNIEALEELSEKAKKHYEEYHLPHVVETVMEVLHVTNEMFEQHKPWNLSKSKDPDSVKELEAVISLAVETLRVSLLILHPIIPKLTSKFLDFLQVPIRNRSWKDTEPLHLTNVSNGIKHMSQNVAFFKRIKN